MSIGQAEVLANPLNADTLAPTVSADEYQANRPLSPAHDVRCDVCGRRVPEFRTSVRGKGSVLVYTPLTVDNTAWQPLWTGYTHHERACFDCAPSPVLEAHAERHDLR